MCSACKPRGWIRPREGEGPPCYDDGASPTKKAKGKGKGLGSELEGERSSSEPKDEGGRSLGDHRRENDAEKEGGGDKPNGEGVPSDTQGRLGLVAPSYFMHSIYMFCFHLHALSGCVVYPHVDALDLSYYDISHPLQM